MIERFSRQLIRFLRPGHIPVAVRPEANFPEVDRKTKADVRREILGKLTARLR
jgi:hypothetical protein